MIRNITLILIGLVTIFAIACSKEESPQPAAPEQAAPAQSQAAATQAAPVQPVAQAPTPTPAPTPVPAPASASETFSSSKGLFRLTHSSGWASRESADGTGRPAGQLPRRAGEVRRRLSDTGRRLRGQRDVDPSRAVPGRVSSSRVGSGRGRNRRRASEGLPVDKRDLARRDRSPSSVGSGYRGCAGFE